MLVNRHASRRGQHESIMVTRAPPIIAMSFIHSTRPFIKAESTSHMLYLFVENSELITIELAYFHVHSRLPPADSSRAVDLYLVTAHAQFLA